jgi:hypothetical protein
MPANFKDATTKKVLAFLEKAADDDYFRAELEKLSRPALRDLLRGYGIRISYRDIKQAPRAVPTKEQCRHLIKMFKLDEDAFAKSQYDYNSSTVAPLILVVAFAMPLMATGESEASAAR